MNDTGVTIIRNAATEVAVMRLPSADHNSSKSTKSANSQESVDKSWQKLVSDGPSEQRDSFSTTPEFGAGVPFADSPPIAGHSTRDGVTAVV